MTRILAGYFLLSAALFLGWACVLGVVAMSQPRPCNAACKTWYAGGADLWANNPFVKGSK